MLSAREKANQDDRALGLECSVSLGWMEIEFKSHRDDKNFKPMEKALRRVSPTSSPHELCSKANDEH